MIDIQELQFGYHTPLNQAFSLQIKSGERIGIFGKNGSGKSTFIHTLCGLQAPLSGEIKLGYDAKITYVPQYIEVQDIFPFSVREVIEMSGVSYDDKNFKIFQKFELENQLDKVYKELSGGQKQRVLIVRSLLAETKILALDEPWQGLDDLGSNSLYQFIADLEINKTWLVIDHDYNRLFSLIDKGLFFKDGMIDFLTKEDISNRSDLIKYFGIYL